MLLAPGLYADPVPEAFGAAPDAYPGVYLISRRRPLTIILVAVPARRRLPRGARRLIGALPQSILLSRLVLAEGAAAFASALLASRPRPPARAARGPAALRCRQPSWACCPASGS
jgi:hypothetical protein